MHRLKTSQGIQHLYLGQLPHRTGTAPEKIGISHCYYGQIALEVYIINAARLFLYRIESSVINLLFSGTTKAHKCCTGPGSTPTKSLGNGIHFYFLPRLLWAGNTILLNFALIHGYLSRPDQRCRSYEDTQVKPDKILITTKRWNSIFNSEMDTCVRRKHSPRDLGPGSTPSEEYTILYNVFFPKSFQSTVWVNAMALTLSILKSCSIVE